MCPYWEEKIDSKPPQVCLQGLEVGLKFKCLGKDMHSTDPPLPGL